MRQDRRRVASGVTERQWPAQRSHADRWIHVQDVLASSYPSSHITDAISFGWKGNMLDKLNFLSIFYKINAISIPQNWDSRP